MEDRDIKSKPIDYQWDFYERAVNNYSVILRLLVAVDDKKDLLHEAPAIFVEGLPFEACRINIDVMRDRGYGFFSIHDAPDNIDMDTIKDLHADTIAPYLLGDYFGYGALYVYPLVGFNEERIGYLILGAENKKIFPESFLREIKMLCNIFNKLILINQMLPRGEDKDAGRLFYKKALDLFPEPVFLIDYGGSIHYANKKAEEEFCVENCLLTGESLNNIFEVNYYILESQSPVEGRLEYISGDNYRTFHLKCYPLDDNDAGNRGLKCLILHDISKDRIENEYAHQIRSMENLSLLAGGLAHDFNNLLTGIIGYTSLMKNFLDERSRLLKYTMAIENAAQRASGLSRHLMNFSRRRLKRDGIVDINAIMDDLVFLFKESYRDIEVIKQASEIIPAVRGDETEIQNLFLNILTNAKDAIEGKGKINISIGLRHMKDKKSFVFVEVHDNGPVMSREIINKAFAPYFTTKKEGRRLGMGLYLAKKIVNNHKGFIEIDSKPNEGSSIIVYLSTINSVKTGDLPREQRVSGAGLGSGLRILIVDDEEYIRDFLKGVLKSQGAYVIEARDGNEAVDIFKDSQEKIDVIILDMIMPGKKGDEVLQEIRNIDKDVKIIISSGFMNEKQKKALKGHNVNGFLDKPYNDRTLIDAINRTYNQD